MKPLLFLLITPASCFAQAKPEPAKEGPAIIAEASGKLIAALTEAIAKDGAAAAISVCSERAPAIATEVGKAHGVTLRRATEKPRNPQNVATPAEKILLAAFVADMQQKKAPQPQTVTQSDGSTTFHAPIVMANPLCIQCHGTTDRDIAPGTLAALQKLYPNDKATGYQLGELRGLWTVTFPASP